MREPATRALPVLLTRPRADAERTAAALQGRAEVIVSPLMRIVFGDALPDVGTALFTSGNGVAAWVAGGGARGLPCWTVGPRTAELAQAAGFEVQGVAEDAASLSALLPAGLASPVHLRGAVQRGNLVARLRARGIPAREAVLYLQKAEAPTAGALAAVAAAPVLAPLWSPRSARLLFEAFVPPLWRNLRPVALSPAVARACPVPPVAVAERPDGPAMLRAILANLGARAVEGGAGTV